MSHELLDRLRDLRLPDGHYAVFGSGPLLVRGVIDDVDDLDVLVRGPAWTAALAQGPVIHLEEFGVEIVDAGGGLTFGRQWGIGLFDVDDLIDTAELIDGVRFVRLQHVVAYKQIADRPKDRDHLAALGAAEPMPSNGDVVAQTVENRPDHGTRPG